MSDLLLILKMFEQKLNLRLYQGHTKILDDRYSLGDQLKQQLEKKVMFLQFYKN